jgi:hypothetical protein
MKKMSIAFLAAMSLASFGCKKKGGAGEAMAKMNDMTEKMCKCTDKACADKVNDDYKKWGEEMSKNASGKEAEAPSAEDQKKMTDTMTKFTECATKAMGGGAAMTGDKPAGDKPAGDKPADDKKPDDKAAPAAGGDLPAECNDYKAAIEKLASCDKLPQASKDALKTSFDTMANSWKDFGSMPAEAKKAAADACKQAADAVNQAATVCK